MIKKENTNPLNKSLWPDQMSWMKDMLERFNATFRERIKKLDLENWRATKAME